MKRSRLTTVIMKSIKLIDKVNHHWEMRIWKPGQEVHVAIYIYILDLGGRLHNCSVKLISLQGTRTCGSWQPSEVVASHYTC